MIKIIHWALKLSNPHNGIGMAMRFCRSNDKTTVFIEMLRHAGLDADIDVIPYFDGGNRVRVKEAIERRPNKTGPYIVMMTGAGRLSDSFPPDCIYFFDFTHQTQNYTALMQGTVGRATGYYAPSQLPLIVLSDNNAESLHRYVDNLGSAEAGTVGTRIIQVKSTARARRTIHMLRERSNDPILRDKFAALEIVLRKRFLRRSLFPMGSRTIGPNGGKCEIWQIFDEETLCYIEDHAADLLSDTNNNSFHLLRPNEPFLGHRYDLKDDMGVVGLRKGHRDGSTLRTLEDNTLAMRRDEWNVHRPQVHYSRYTGDVIAITFRCQQGFKQRTSLSETGPLPSSKSHMKEFAVGEQRRLIDQDE